jgi:hypothetical protein
MTLVNTPLAPRSRRQVLVRRLALAVGAAFLCRWFCCRSAGARPRCPRHAGPRRRCGRSGGTLGEISRLQAAVRRAPAASAPRVALAGEYLQRVRETGDVAFYQRAELLLRGVLAREPRNADALVALGGLALSRHDFRGGLRLARRSRPGWRRCRSRSTRSSSSAATTPPAGRCSGWRT